jgi:hypothetical protein
MGALWDMIDTHLERQEFPPSKRRLALRLGVAPTTLKNWRVGGFADLPKRENLEAVADLVGKPYEDVLKAALLDTGYAKGLTCLGDTRPRRPRSVTRVEG